MKLAVQHSLLVFDQERDDPRVPESGLVLPIAEHRTKKRKPTIIEVIADAGWRFFLPTVCKVNGEYYSQAEWQTKKLTANDNVQFLSRPLGGGAGGSGSSAKTIGAIVGMVALTALAPWAMGAIGLTGMAASIGSSLLIAGGAMAISHFLKPKTGGKTNETEELYSFAFGGNQARPLQPIPVGYGKQLSQPDFAAPRYSEYSGDNMVEYGLFALGCGKYDIEEIRIADTRIWTKAAGNSDFPGVTVEIVNPGEKVDLFPVNVVTSSEVSGNELSTDFTGGFTVNAAGTVAKELMLDFIWPSGAFVTYKEKQLPTPTQVVVEARLINDAGAPVGDWSQIFNKTYSLNKQSQIRITERVQITPGRWQVRARRVNPTITGQQLFGGKVSGTDTVIWSSLRAKIDGPQSFPGVTTIALRVNADASMSGLMNGQIGVIATRKIPVWKNGAFVEEASRSIAWAALDMWRNTTYGARLKLDQVDFQAFVAYDDLWKTLGHTFDHVFKEPQSLEDSLETILKAGRAMPAMVGDRLTIVRDEPRGLPRMLFTDYDIVKGSLSEDYTLADEDLADGIVGEYIDETTWRLAEVNSAPAGTPLARPSRVQLTGVTKRGQAIGLTRFMAAENTYRRIMVSWTARAEGRLLKRGDLVLVSSEEPMTWGESAEVVDYDAGANKLVFDHALTWASSGSHWLQVRRRDGQPWGPFRVTRGANDREAIANAQDLTEVAGAQLITLWDAIARSDVMDRPSASFSQGQPRELRVLITDGVPDQDGEHIQLTGTVDDTAVYDALETGVEPLPEIPNIFSSAFPVITTLGANVYQRHLNLVLMASWRPARGAVRYTADVSYDQGGSWIRAYDGDMSTFEAIVGGADVIRVRVAGVTAANVVGAYSVIEVNPPDLELSNTFVRMQLREEDFQSQVRRGLEFQRLFDPIAIAAADARVVAKTATDKGEAAITIAEQVKVDADQALAAYQIEVSARFGENESDITDLYQTRVTADQATALAQTRLEAAVGLTSGTVEQYFATQASITGQVTSQWVVKVEAGDAFGGIEFIAQDGVTGKRTISELRVATNRFMIGLPAAGAAFQSVFTVDTQEGFARVAIDGDLIARGTISAARLEADYLSAYQGRINILEGGIIRSIPSAGENKMIINLDTGTITIRD